MYDNAYVFFYIPDEHLNEYRAFKENAKSFVSNGLFKISFDSDIPFLIKDLKCKNEFKIMGESKFEFVSKYCNIYKDTIRILFNTNDIKYRENTLKEFYKYLNIKFDDCTIKL